MLFPDGSDELPPIAGLMYSREFVTTAEEAELVTAIDAGHWDTTWDRRRESYGKAYGRKSPADPMPSWGRMLADRIYARVKTPHAFDQMLVNEYLPGQGIAMHSDYAPFDRAVASLSLLSACVMDLDHPASASRHVVLLEPRSLRVMADEVRYEWRHGIARRKKDRWQVSLLLRRRRVSVTFRRLISEP